MNQVFGFQVEEQVSRWRSRCTGGGAGGSPGTYPPYVDGRNKDMSKELISPVV